MKNLIKSLVLVLALSWAGQAGAEHWNVDEPIPDLVLLEMDQEIIEKRIEGLEPLLKQVCESAGFLPLPNKGNSDCADEPKQSWETVNDYNKRKAVTVRWRDLGHKLFIVILQLSELEQKTKKQCKAGLTFKHGLGGHPHVRIDSQTISCGWAEKRERDRKQEREDARKERATP